MTAVIGILNKSGVALAADSAVTFSGGNGRKIYNSAYKIFTLSKFHPVSIMIYNAATFMGIPWEILVKEYRNQLKQTCFDTLVQYQDDFIEYLKSRLDLISDKNQRGTVSGLIRFVTKRVLEDVTKANIDAIERERSNKAKKELITELVKTKIPELLSYYDDWEVMQEFKTYKFDDFKKQYNNEFHSSYEEFYSELKLSNTVKTKLFKIIYRLVVTEQFQGAWTGLVFSGYGEQEIYPSCLPIQIGEVIDGRIRWMVDNQNVAIITDENDATIRPFAQRDVIDTILSGIDGTLETTVYGSFEEFLQNFISFLKSELDPGDGSIADKLDKIAVRDLIMSYSENFQDLKRNIHIEPLMSSISSLSKEDLAELAESLVYLTYLKRRMSFSEESVGGPIDVAIITKGDGFVWLKRKHYFDKELNHDFLHRYLN